MEPILEIENLQVWFQGSQGKIPVIQNISLSLFPGEILAVVGASGSGKTMLSQALMGMLPQDAAWQGILRFEGKTLDAVAQKQQLALIPQTSAYLDPLMKMEHQVPLQSDTLGQKTAGLYPFQCSGGMIRSALFGLAYEKNAKVLIADEPTPGLDLERAVATLGQLKALAKQGKAVLLITHDIDLALEIADRVAVFYQGTILEIATKEQFQQKTLHHPYTKALFEALPQNGFTPVDWATVGSGEEATYGLGV